MTRKNAEKTAIAQARVLGHTYGVFELASGEFVPLRLPLRLVGKTAADEMIEVCAQVVA